MLKRKPVCFLAVLAFTGVAACGSQDVPAGEPGGMGAGRPDTTATQAPTEDSATQVLDGMDIVPPATQQDTSAHGGAQGQAQPGQPQRPRQ